jgi:hypothetical protein
MSNKLRVQPKVQKPEQTRQTLVLERAQAPAELRSTGGEQAHSWNSFPHQGATRPLRHAALLDMQRRFGNAFVQRVLAAERENDVKRENQPLRSLTTSVVARFPAPAAPEVESIDQCASGL